MIALWGSDLIQVYNDGYRLLMMDKHPAGLGQPTRECWPEVWHINEPIYGRVLAGDTVTFENALYPVARHGLVEDLRLTLTYSPLRDRTGTIAGVLVTVVETTERVKAEVALRESGERFRAFVTASSDIVYRMSPDWTEMLQLEGRSSLRHTDQPSMGWLDSYIPLEDQPAVGTAVERAIESKSVFEL